MKPEDDPWLENAHKNAEHLDREIKILASLTSPIRQNLPIITKYQDFWNKAKQITGLFKDLKPLARDDRDLLWKQFNTLCREVKENQKPEYGKLESVSRGHFDEIMKQVELAGFSPDAPPRNIHALVERGQALKTAGDLLGKYKQEMLAKHKKTCFDRIQKIRTIHDNLWDTLNAGKPKPKSENVSRVQKNLEVNNERYRKAAIALENFQISADHIRRFLETCDDPEKIERATAQLTETERRINDIREGIGNFRKWIEDDERTLKEI
ncbi:MAG: hypothetical protein LUQ31_07080 [Methanoregula sp.]|nr:hypothetical protein [Methanoregula sp.]